MRTILSRYILLWLIMLTMGSGCASGISEILKQEYNEKLQQVFNRVVA